MVWYKKFSSVLIGLGLRCLETDHGVFLFQGTWKGEEVHCIVVIHVDDGMGASNSPRYLAWIKTGILEEFGLKDLGAVKSFLGVQIDHNRDMRELWLHQKGYITTLLSDHDLSDCNLVSTPMDDKHPLGLPSTTFPDVPHLSTKYQTLMGCLLFLTICTCPDITYAVNYLTRFNLCVQNPNTMLQQNAFFVTWWA
jgi:hypothetical protein